MASCGVSWSLDIAEMNRMCLVLFDMNNRIFGPYWASIHRIPISVMEGVDLDAGHVPNRGQVGAAK
jgi:hypothetical protein